MADTEEMGGSSVEGVASFGDEDRERLGEIDGGKLNVPCIRRSERRIPPKAPFARGRLRKSGPKSPMMRMAEMRRSGLRGRELRHSGRKGLEEMEMKSNRGRKGNGGRDSNLTTITEDKEVEVEGLEEEGDVSEGVNGDVEGVMDKEVESGSVSEGVSSEKLADNVFDVLPETEGQEEMALDLRSCEEEGSCEVEEKGAEQVLVVDEVGFVMQESDIVLDLYEAQPLQNMDFLKKGEMVGTMRTWPEVRKGTEGSKWANNEEVMQLEFPPGGKFSDKDFPSLKEGVSKKGKDREGLQRKKGKDKNNQMDGAET